MTELSNQPREISLVGLLKEFKNNIVWIVIVTLLFAAAAHIYTVKTTVTRYSYETTIRLPSNLSDKDKLNISRILRNDIGSKLWKEGNKGALTGIWPARESNVLTNSIKLYFEGEDPAYLKKVADAYTVTALKKANEEIAEIHKEAYAQYYLKTVTTETQNVSSALKMNTMSPESATRYLEKVKQLLETEYKNKGILHAKIMSNANTPVKPISVPTYTTKSALVGFFLCIALITCKYCW